MNAYSRIPRRDPLVDPKTGMIADRWLRYLTQLDGDVLGVVGLPQEVPYSAGDYTGGDGGDGGSGTTMTWAVDEADILTNYARRSGTRLWWSFIVLSTVVGGTPQQRLRIRLPFGLSAPARYQTVAIASAADAGVAADVYGQIEPTLTTHLGIIRQDAADWTAGANTALQFTVELEVEP